MVLLGNGAGGFIPAGRSPFATGGSTPSSVAVADFNADGRQDIAVANTGSHNVSVLLNLIGAPSVTTGAASGLAPTAATLTGTVNPEDETTTYRFDYGTSTAYGLRVPASEAPVGSDSTDHAVSQTISGLQPNTTYHFRLVATDPAGGFYGTDGTFTTAAAPLVVTSPASSLTATSAVLNGRVNPQNSSTSYRFEYGISTDYGSRMLASDAPVSSDRSDHPVAQTISGLASNTTYHYRLVATNAAGTSYGADQTFTTLAAPDGTPPRLSAFRLSPVSFRAEHAGPSLVLSGKKGTKISYRLTERATVTFTIEQASRGRKSKGRCLADTPARRRLPRCTRYVLLKGSFKHNGKSGENSFRFTGRLANATLKPGNYRLIATGRDVVGNISAPTRVSFTIRR